MTVHVYDVVHYVTQHTNMRDYFLAALVIITIAVGYILLLQSANDRIEIRCAAAGGQVLTQPGEVSKCLRPAQ